MIDIHFHGLPCVDDGPDNKESALQLIREAYQQGTREIVLTPHMYHPMSFGHIPFNEQMHEGKEELFKIFFDQVWSSFPGLVLHEGAEIYMSRRWLGQLDQIPIKPIADTDYVLVEFSRYISYHQMDNLLHELRLAGYKPIIAHLEEYSHVLKNIDHAKMLHKDGYVIQVNASHILQNKNTSDKRAKQLIDLGVVDIVASDAHSLNRRPPKLADAKAYVAKTYGEKIANQWFFDNPERILQNKPIIKEYQVEKKKHKFFFGLFSVMLVVFMTMSVLAKSDLFLESAGLESISISTQSAQTETAQTKTTQTKSVQATPTIPLAQETDLPKEVSATLEEMPEEEILEEEIEQNQTIVSSQPIELTHEEQLTGTYIEYLETLQATYLAEVERCYIELKGAIDIEDATQQESTVNRILAEIGELESDADNKVYKTLYDMQNDLESYEYDVEIVRTTRQHYLDMKAAISAEYEAKLQNASQSEIETMNE